MKDAILDHMLRIGMIDELQHGGTKGRSTVTQLLEQQAKILEYLENGDNVEVIYLDFCKAYDKVDHLILLKKLEAMGVTGSNLMWIKNWLLFRKQRVRIKDSQVFHRDLYWGHCFS